MTQQPSSPFIVKSPKANEPRPATAAEIPKTPPPGINYIDVMCDAQDRRDRAPAIRRAIEDRAVEVLLREKEAQK